VVHQRYVPGLLVVAHEASVVMIMLGKINYTTDDIKYYKQNVCCSTITLNDKMRLTTLCSVSYVKQSPLMPRELQPEVQEHIFDVPPVVMSHCLRFRLATEEHM
jgi:hypothetical protein